MRIPQVQHTQGGGELGPELGLRNDLEVFGRTVLRSENFITDNSGQSRYRPGLNYVVNTRRNAPTYLFPFIFNTIQAYMLAFMDDTANSQSYMRVFKDSGQVLETAFTITGITNANPAVITTTGSPGWVDGNSVFISGVGGMPEINGRVFQVDQLGANSFALYQLFNTVPVNSTSWGTFNASVPLANAQAARVYEITVPYIATDYNNIVYAQQADTMYMTCDGYQPRKLTRTAHTNWSLTSVAFIDGPYFPENTSAVTFTATGTLTPGGSATITASAATFAATDVGRCIRLFNTSGTKWSWGTITAYTSATVVTATVGGSVSMPSGATVRWQLGAFSSTLGWPKLVELYQQRLLYANTATFPETIFGSRTAEISADFDTFGAAINGTDVLDTDPFTFRIASAHSNAIRAIKATDLFLFVGTYGSEHQMTGGSPGTAITPSNVNVQAFSFFGIATAQPVVADNNVMYMQRNRRTVRSIIYDPFRQGFISDDKTIYAPHITEGFVKKQAFQVGPPNICWQVLDSGLLIGMTYEQRQQVLAWHRHPLAAGLIAEDLGVIPQPEGPDQLWVQLKATDAAGNVQRWITFMNDQQFYPRREDYYLTDPDDDATDTVRKAAEDADTEVYLRAMWEAQKLSVHVDAAVTYDGSGFPVTMTPGTGATGAVGTLVTFTAGSALFTSSMIEREIWAKGVAGRAVIVVYTDSTHVTCEIREPFTSLATIAAGGWFLTTDTLHGLDHLSGLTVRTLLDGGDGGKFTVTAGTLTLDRQYSVVVAGLTYRGFVIGNIMSSAAKDRSDEGRTKKTSEVAAFIYASGSAQMGTNPYYLQPILPRPSNAAPGRPAPLATGWRPVVSYDSASTEPRIFIKQEKPTPCIVQAVRATVDASALVSS